MATPPPINDVPNYGDQVPFLPKPDPKALYRGTLNVLKIFYHEGYKGNAFIAFVKPATCTTDALRIGQKYCIRFPRDLQDKVKDQARMSEFKRFIAAVSGSPTIEGFNSDEAIKTYCEMGDELEIAALKVDVDTSARKATKPAKDGSYPTYVNFSYYPTVST